MDLYVGQSSLRGELARYARHLNFLELLAEPSLLPKITKLAGYRKQAPTFPFSVVLSPRCFGAGAEAERSLEYGLNVAAALEPRWLVVRTPPSLHPGPAGEKRLKEFVERLPKDKFQIAWEARGLWEMSGVRQVSTRLGIAPVLDASNAASWGELPIEGVCYARLLGIGIAQRPSESMLARLAERIIACQELYLAVDGANAVQTRQLLATLLEDLAELADDDEDLDDEDDSEESTEDDSDDDSDGDEEEEDDSLREEEE